MQFCFLANKLSRSGCNASGTGKEVGAWAKWSLGQVKQIRKQESCAECSSPAQAFLTGNKWGKQAGLLCTAVAGLYLSERKCWSSLEWHLLLQGGSFLQTSQISYLYMCTHMHTHTYVSVCIKTLLCQVSHWPQTSSKWAPCSLCPTARPGFVSSAVGKVLFWHPPPVHMWGLCSAFGAMGQEDAVDAVLVLECCLKVTLPEGTFRYYAFAQQTQSAAGSVLPTHMPQLYDL